MSMRRLAALGVATVAASAALFAAQTAYAAGSTEVLSWGALNNSGTNVLTTDTLTGGATAPGSFVFTSSGKTVTITCTAAAITAKATSNPTAPSSAGLSISQLTFSDGSAGQCTLSGLTGVTVVSITLKPTTPPTPAVGNVTSVPAALNITSLNEAVVLHSGLGNVTCDYGTTATVTSISGAITNPNSSGTGGSIVFSNETVGLISGTGVCGASGSTGKFNATFGSFLDSAGTGGNTAVYDNPTA